MWARLITWSSDREPDTEELPGCSCLGAAFELFLSNDEESSTLVARCSSCRRTLQVNVGRSSLIRIQEGLL